MEEIERELSTMKIKRGGDFHSLREEVFVKSKAFASLKLLTSSVIQEVKHLLIKNEPKQNLY